MGDMKHMIPRGVRVISLDAGGTLICPRNGVGQVYADVAKEFGWGRIDAVELESRFRTIWGRRGDFDFSREAWAGVVSETFEELVDAPGDAGFFETVYSRFGEARVWAVFADVVPALDWLCGYGYRLMVVSNWDERLNAILGGLGLRPYFGEVVISVEVGARKPAGEIFEHAAARVGARPYEVLHVGDSVGEDRDGALASGWHALWLDRAGRGKGNGAIKSLRELAGPQMER